MKYSIAVAALLGVLSISDVAARGDSMAVDDNDELAELDNNNELAYDDIEWGDHDQAHLMTGHKDPSAHRMQDGYQDLDQFDDDEDALIHLGNEDDDLDYDSGDQFDEDEQQEHDQEEHDLLQFKDEDVYDDEPVDMQQLQTSTPPVDIEEIYLKDQKPQDESLV